MVKKVKKIYVITAMRFGYEYTVQKPFPDGRYYSFRTPFQKGMKKHFTILEQRTWGWCSTLKNAKLMVTEWASEWILDNSLTEVVIEEFKEGICCYEPKEWWYKWHGTSEKGKYKPWKKPEQYSHTIGFGMG